MNKEIVGVLFPIKSKYVERIFRYRTPVVVKYLSRIPRKPRNYALKRGMKILFYVSGSGRKIAGQARIRDVEFLTPAETLTKYSDRLFLPPDDLVAYIAMQPNRDATKPLLVLDLDEVVSFPDGIRHLKNMTMAVEYFDQEFYSKIVSMISAERRTMP